MHSSATLEPQIKANSWGGFGVVHLVLSEQCLKTVEKMLEAAILWLSLAVSCVYCSSMPQAVQLGGAIVAAVEQDAEQEAETEQRLQQAWLQSVEQQIWRFVNDELSAQEMSDALNSFAEEPRGKHHRNKKLLKMLYPLLGAAILAKVVMLPLVLKALTALSTSSFVMGKIALFISGLLATKWILSSNHAQDRVEVIHTAGPALKAYHTHTGELSDMSGSASSWWPMRQRYIPLGSIMPGKDAAYIYPQHRYEGIKVDKPFL